METEVLLGARGGGGGAARAHVVVGVHPGALEQWLLRFSSKVLVVPSRLPQVEPSRWLVDVRARTLAVLPLSTAGGAVRKAAEGALDMRSILVEGDLIAVSA